MKKALIIGSGILALTLGQKLTAAGYTLIFCNRSGALKTGDALPVGADYQCVRLNLLDNNQFDPDVISGIDAIYFCAAPKYWLWQEELVPLVKSSLSVATKLGVPFVYADNLYAYGNIATPINEETPRNPQTRKGIARNQALELVLHAHHRGEICAVVVQASDFYGPGVGISMVGKALFDSVKAGQIVNCLGNIDKLHSFTYIEDFAEAMICVKNSPDSFGQIWIAPCAKPLSIRTFVEIAARHLNQPAKMRVAPRLVFWFLGLINKPIRELKEVDYLYYEDFVVDSKKFEARFQLNPTPIEDGIRRTLAQTAAPEKAEVNIASPQISRFD